MNPPFSKYVKPSSHLIAYMLLAPMLAMIAPSVICQEQPPSEEMTAPKKITAPSNSSSKSKSKKSSTRTAVEEVIITGSKLNLMDAQDMKRSAGTMIDAISAEQIGLLPDRSSLDAMQRLPGVAVERFAAPNDPDHFSVEGSTIILRGMNQTRSEFNKRDSFSAYSGRGLSYSDIPPELLSSIEMAKNQTADMIEGGIGGTINLITRKPLDIADQLLSFSVDESYGDLAQVWSPTYSALLAKVFDSPIGNWGVLVNYVNSELVGQSHGIQSEAYLEFLASKLVTENNPNPVGTRAEDFLGEDGNGIVWAPNGANVLMKEDERNRDGLTAAIQFESTDGRFRALTEYIRSESTLTWNERAIKYQGGFFGPDTRPTAPLAGTHFLFDENGLFQSGVLVEQTGPWRLGSSGRSRVPSDGGLEGYKQWGHKIVMDSRLNETNSLVEDVSVNLQFDLSDRLTLEGDFQHVKAKARVDDISVHIGTWAMFDYDTRGDLPHLNLLEPWLGERDQDRANGVDKWDIVTNGAPDFPGFGGDPLGDQNYFQDPNSYLWRSAMDHYERSEGESNAARFDLTFDVGNGFLRSVKAGYRFSDRSQTVRETSWNWGALAPEWSGGLSNWDLAEDEFIGSGIGWLPDIKPLQDGYEYVNWSNFMGGGALSIPGGQSIHANESLLRAIMGSHPSRTLYETPLTGDNNWLPYPGRDDVESKFVNANGDPVFEGKLNVPLDSKYGIFTPDEINTTVETKNALYARLDFAGGDELPFSGNVGLRYIKMNRESGGVVDFPLIAPVQNSLEAFPPSTVQLPVTWEKAIENLKQQVADGLYETVDKASTELINNWIYIPYFYLPNELRGFTAGIPRLDANGEQLVSRNHLIFDPYSTYDLAKSQYETILPSFNIKIDLTPTLVGRFAFAKSVAFPDLGDVRNRTEFASIDATEHSDEIKIKYRQVDIEDGLPLTLVDSVELNRPKGGTLFLGEGGNPYMKPMESMQYDFSLEWYFSDFGQLSAAIFHKNLSDYFSRGVITREFTNGVSNVTQPVSITTNRNGGDAKLDGIELNYNQFFEGVFNGFGIQVTYTYIDANSVPNNEKDYSDEQWYNSVYEDTGIRVDPSKLPLQGQSDETINLIGMYENDTISAYLAYNWRSKYLLTTRDVISKAPLWNDDHGELDGSIFYKLDDHFTVGIQAENITNSRSDILMILNDELLTTGRSWFVSDRRIALVLRGDF